MTMQPMPCMPSSLAMSSSDVSGVVVNTLPALLLQNCSDVHPRFLQPGSFRPVACDILSWTGRPRKRRTEVAEKSRTSQERGSGCSASGGLLAAVEEAEEQQAEQKAADMRLPGDRRPRCAGDLDRAEAEISVDRHPERRERRGCVGRCSVCPRLSSGAPMKSGARRPVGRLRPEDESERAGHLA